VGYVVVIAILLALFFGGGPGDITLAGVAVFFGLLLLLAFFPGYNGGFLAATLAMGLFLIFGFASGLIPPLQVAAGVNEDDVSLQFGTSDSLTAGDRLSVAADEEDGVVVSNCRWLHQRVRLGRPAPAAAFRLVNGNEVPKRVRVELIFGNAEEPSADGDPIFFELHDWTPALPGGEHWLVPPTPPPELEGPANTIDQPVDPVVLLPPSGPDNALITWCGVRISDVRGT